MLHKSLCCTIQLQKALHHTKFLHEAPHLTSPLHGVYKSEAHEARARVRV